MNDIIVYEPECVGYAHELVNAGFLAHLSALVDSVSFYADRQHYECIGRFLKGNNQTKSIVHYPIRVVNTDLFFRELFWKLFQTIRIFNHARHSLSKKVLFLSITSLHLLLVKLLLLVYRDLSVDIVLHGVIEELNKKPPRFWRLKRYITFGTVFPRATSNRIAYILISPLIQRKLQSLFPKVENIFAVDHPLVPGLIVPKKQKDTIVFCSIGNINPSRGSSNLLAFDAILKKSGGTYEYKVLGKVSGVAALDQTSLQVLNRWCGREELDLIMQDVDYVFIPYQPGSYAFTVSGVLFDAIRYGKPIIALRTDVIDYYFKKYGNIGFLADTVDDLERIVNEKILPHRSPGLYQQQCARLAEVQKEIIQSNQSELARILQRNVSK
jgi:glycosyltransferase involved in cell wall biosynthesis